MTGKNRRYEVVLYYKERLEGLEQTVIKKATEYKRIHDLATDNEDNPYATNVVVDKEDKQDAWVNYLACLMFLQMIRKTKKELEQEMDEAVGAFPFLHPDDPSLLGIIG